MRWTGITNLRTLNNRVNATHDLLLPNYRLQPWTGILFWLSHRSGIHLRSLSNRGGGRRRVSVDSHHKVSGVLLGLSKLATLLDNRCLLAVHKPAPLIQLSDGDPRSLRTH